MDEEDSDSLFYMNYEDYYLGNSIETVNVEEELNQFRLQWQNEIRSLSLPAANSSPKARHGKTATNANSQSSQDSQPSVEDEAKYLFLQGVNAEKNGKLNDAIKYYRRAVQLVPDIEFKIEELRLTYKDRTRTESSESLESEAEEGEDTDEELSSRLQRLQLDSNKFCHPKLPQQSTHISCLPAELLILLFRWVVSSDLDIMSIQSLAQVCRGFYLCARDEEVWRMICARVWGRNCGKPSKFGCYKEMYFSKPHLLFNGCYISKISYYRQGEKSLDGNYQPMHVVEYYRYVRFTLDGHILMLTSPADPAATVPQLRTHHCDIQGVLFGYFKTAGTQITAVLKRRKVKDNSNVIFRYKRQQRGRVHVPDESDECFHVEFSLCGIRGRPCAQLRWSRYSVHTTYRTSGSENIAAFDLSNNAFPPLIFSRVKSYTKHSEHILQ